MESTPHLQLLLSRYAVVQGMQVAQTAACNRLHDIKQRLARWLLMTQDRVDSEALPITHDFLAKMLGTDRPTVMAAGVLQREQIIEYTRGAVKIVNRKKLEDSACECYGIIQQYNGELGLKLESASENPAANKGYTIQPSFSQPGRRSSIPPECATRHQCYKPPQGSWLNSAAIKVSDLSADARNHLAAIEQDDIDSVVSLGIDQLSRVVRILEHNVLKVLWWDPDRAVCPTTTPNT